MPVEDSVRLQANYQTTRNEVCPSCNSSLLEWHTTVNWTRGILKSTKHTVGTGCSTAVREKRSYQRRARKTPFVSSKHAGEKPDTGQVPKSHAQLSAAHSPVSGLQQLLNLRDTSSAGLSAVHAQVEWTSRRPQLWDKSHGDFCTSAIGLVIESFQFFLSSLFATAMVVKSSRGSCAGKVCQRIPERCTVSPARTCLPRSSQPGCHWWAACFAPPFLLHGGYTLAWPM